MNQFTNYLLRAGTWANQNKYLSAIKNAFQTFLPFTIVGAAGVLWTSVICNSSTGLGALFPPIMGLSFLNPAFSARNFCTIGCIAIGVTYLVGSEIGKANGRDSVFCGLLSVIALISVTNTSTVVTADDGSVIRTITGIFGDSLGSRGLFTGMLIAILASELYHQISKVDALQIKMPEQVPTSVAKSFSALIPAFLVIMSVSLLNLFVVMVSGNYINDLIFAGIQAPLQHVGGSLPGFLMFELIALLFWAVGLHGDNLISGVLTPILTGLILENLDAVTAGSVPVNIINNSFQRGFYGLGGTGMTISLTLAILIAGKRPENRSTAKIALVPNLFNIGEINVFGIPVVLNPILLIPFIAAPMATILFGYIMTAIHICPVMYVQVPWTMHPVLHGFLATGGSVMGGLCELVGIVIATLIYLPFVVLYERQQTAADKSETES